MYSLGGEMNIEPYVVSLELAKQLKEAGYPQRKGLFYWCKQNPYYPEEKPIWLLYSYPISYRKKKPLRGSDYDTSNNPLYHEILAAPISDELLDKLPKEIIAPVKRLANTNSEFFLHIINRRGWYDIRYLWEYNEYYQTLNDTYFEDKKLPDAIASLWLKLKKEGCL
jgi:hypothetical protein